MKGLVLAAGKGTRLSELNLVHKSFAVVHKKHVIEYSLDFLVGTDDCPLVSEIIIIVGWHRESIMNELGCSYRGVPIKYVIQQEQLGVAHAVKIAEKEINDDFIMCLADEILFDSDLPGMIGFFYRSNADCVCGVVNNPDDFSMKPIAYEVSESKVLYVREKPKSYPNSLRGIGECIFSRKALRYVKDLAPNPIRGEFEMGDWIQSIVNDRGNVFIYDIAKDYINVNYAKDIEDANLKFQASEKNK